MRHGCSGRNDAPEEMTPEYRAWGNMKTRCVNPNDAKRFARYGGRGIAIDPEWMEDFAAFLAHIGPRPSAGMSVDRIDNERGYEPGNVRWATALEQRLNQRTRPGKVA